MEKWLKQYIEPNLARKLTRFVYFMEATGSVTDGLIKIGHTDSVELRRRTLELQYKCEIIHTRMIPLVLTGYNSYSYKIEQILHKRFISYRCGVSDGKCMSREWYYPGDELVEFIRNNTIPFLDGMKGKTLVEVAIALAATNAPYTPRLAATEQGEAT